MDIRLRRSVHDWEEALMELLVRVYGFQSVGERRDEIRWNLSKTGSFQVKSYYQALCGGLPSLGKKFGKLMLR